jgi:hypothetical protein
MKPSPLRSHNVVPGHSDEPAVPEPTYAERARTLVDRGRVGALSTLSERRPGFPFGSVMPYSLDAAGRPLLLISALAMHTRNLRADPRSSLLVTEEDAGRDPLGAGRVTLVGEAAAVPGSETAEARDLYLERQPSASYWVDFPDFSFFRLEITDVYYVGGFGVMGWVEATDYAAAVADPLAESAASILDHMNQDHADALVLLARHFAGQPAEGAIMTRVDRLGFHLRYEADGRFHGCRIAFLREVSSPAEAREVLVEMVGEARAAQR